MEEITRLNLFRSQARPFEKAARRALDTGGRPPVIPSCPGWSVSDLVGHLDSVHRYLALIMRERLTEAAAPPTSPATASPRTRRRGPRGPGRIGRPPSTRHPPR